MVEEIRKTPQIVNVKDRDQMNSRPLPTIGNALEDTPGTLIQQSTYAQVSPFLRGLTGNQVLNLLDGVRFNNSVYRFGPNQYLALLEPSQVQRVEAMLGSNRLTVRQRCSGRHHQCHHPTTPLQRQTWSGTSWRVQCIWSQRRCLRWNQYPAFSRQPMDVLDRWGHRASSQYLAIWRRCGFTQCVSPLLWPD